MFKPLQRCQQIFMVDMLQEQNPLIKLYNQILDSTLSPGIIISFNVEQIIFPWYFLELAAFNQKENMGNVLFHVKCQPKRIILLEMRAKMKIIK